MDHIEEYITEEEEEEVSPDISMSQSLKDLSEEVKNEGMLTPMVRKRSLLEFIREGETHNYEEEQ